MQSAATTMETLDNRLEKIEKSIEDIRVSLLGNDFNKTGLIHTIQEHHQRLTALEKQLERGKWLIIGLSAGSGIGIYELLKKVLS
jgi:predicted outer membrane protein